jgi:hypothetical protein
MLKFGKQGYMLANLIVGIIIFGALAGAMALTIHAINEAQGSAAARAQSEAERTAQKESSLYGLDATGLNPLSAAGASPSTMTNPSTLGTSGGGADIQGMVLSGDTAGRSSAAGVRVVGADGTGTTPVDPTPDPVDLVAPTVNYNGALPLTAGLFPISDMVTLPTGNPSGTFYTYTTDGTNPQRTGSVWNGTESYTALNLPSEFRIQAYHPNDDLYRPSSIAVGSLSATAAISYDREPVLPGGYTIYDFSYEMVRDGTNRILLDLDNKTGLYSMEYSIEAGPATGIGTSTALALDEADWTSASIQLDVRVVGVNSDFPAQPSWNRTYILNAVATVLEAPIINYGPAFPSPASFPISDLVTLPAGNPAETQYRYTVNGSNPTSSSALWTGSESFSPVDLPVTFKIQAYHPSGVFYSPSAVASMTFTSPVPVIGYGREGSLPAGYTDFEYDRSMIDGPTNRAELTLTGHEGVFSMRYRINGGTWISGGTFARFMPALSEWSTGSCLLEVEVVQEGYFPVNPAWNQSYTLTVKPVKLATPIINHGPAFPSSFPVTNMVSYPPSNPPGTFYHYRTDGGDPTDAHPLWNNSTSYSVTNLPAHFAVVAYPDDPIWWLPSDVAKVSFVNPGGPGGIGSLDITYDREGVLPSGYDPYDFDYLQITGGDNRIMLEASNQSGLYGIEVNYGGSWLWSNSPDVIFHVPTAFWTADTHYVTGRLRSRNTYFPLSSAVTRTWEIHRVKVILPPPVPGT